MGCLVVGNVALRGVSACVPKNVEENVSSGVFAGKEEALKFMQTTGVVRRHMVEPGVTTADLCLKAAEALLEDLDWERDTVDCLVFVTQTPDYPLPATSCLLQTRLGLKEECYALDISLGCSGWVYGMSVLSSLVAGGCFKRGLLLAGDTISGLVSPTDKSTRPLFGDAGTAAALEFSEGGKNWYYHFATDGKGYDAIIVPDGGFRSPASPGSFTPVHVEEGIIRSGMQIALNGMDVFSFGISKAPQSVKKLLEYAGRDKDAVDYYIFHQANHFMNEMIRKKLKLARERVPYSLEEYGNTSSATIPLTMVAELGERLRNDSLEILGCGFGVGLSWGSILFDTDRIACPPVITI